MASARSNDVGLMAGFTHAPVAGGTSVLPGVAAPRKTTRTICARSMAWSKASRSVGLSSSRFFGFFGLELKMTSVWSAPGTSWIAKPAFLRVAIAVAGTSSIASMLCAFSAATSASSFENICRPKPSTCGFGP